MANVICMSLSAGGSVSNMYAMNLARYKFFPEIKEKGLSGLPRLVLFTSEEVKTEQSFLNFTFSVSAKLCNFPIC